jgi:SAM-dependent methyltransferase
MTNALDLHNVAVRRDDAQACASWPAQFDCVWSLSVIEHVCGRYDDRAALRFMWEAVRPGGRLIVTVPVDRKPWDEYRTQRYYGGEQSPPNDSRSFFFQRWYDETTLRSYWAELGVKPAVVRWFGEREAGHFASYEQRWIESGLAVAVDDPREIVDHYREFPSWKEMVGQGVCGFTLVKPGI